MASMMTNFYVNINNLYTFTSDFDSQLQLSRLYNQNNMLDLSKINQVCFQKYQLS